MNMINNFITNIFENLSDMKREMNTRDMFNNASDKKKTNGHYAPLSLASSE